MTSLVYAVKFGYLNIAECLLKAGAHVNGAGGRQIAMTIAAQRRDQEMVNLLSEYDEDVSQEGPRFGA